MTECVDVFVLQKIAAEHVRTSYGRVLEAHENDPDLAAAADGE
jgi:hypothetical protein